ncbi:MAG: hypothetical protein KAI71_02665 [Candidatus Pacebacteria bacterium]|nr:hypothetical protein [Candidatus Paceibacterota bacterium]
MTLKDELEKGLVDRLGFSSKSYLLGMAIPVSEVFGETESPEEVANLIIDKVIEDMPLEISSMGPDGPAAFFQSFNYDCQKEEMIKVAKEVKSAQK